MARRLGAVESRNITRIDADGPIFWEEARGSNVRDVDGNIYVDLTAGFGVAFTGHGNPRVAGAIAHQAQLLPHAMGDVHPADTKVLLLERLAAITPGDLSVSILASAGAEAVEAALKTAALRTGCPGILSFRGAYHGLTYGALAVTWREHFRAPFRPQLNPLVHFAPFPTAAEAADSTDLSASLREIEQTLTRAEVDGAPVGAVIVEPIQGRGGIRFPAPGFLAALRDLCDGSRCILIFDEIYTGMGRTGRWFACQHDGITPDILLVGKALTGSLPLSAAIGRPDVMAAWPAATGDAIHTSTFLGNPIACAAALAQIDEIERHGLISRAATLGDRIHARTDAWCRHPPVQSVRGLGLLQAVQLQDDDAAPARAARVVTAAAHGGVLLLTEGERGTTLAITPPAVISIRQLDYALDIVEAALQGLAEAD